MLVFRKRWSPTRGGWSHGRSPNTSPFLACMCTQEKCAWSVIRGGLPIEGLPVHVQWNLQIMDTLGWIVLSTIERLSSFRGKMYCHYIIGWCIGKCPLYRGILYSECPLSEVSLYMYYILKRSCRGRVEYQESL